MGIGDPSLGSIQYPVVPVPLGRGGGRAGVAPVARFGEAEAADLAAVHERGDVLLLQGLIGKVFQGPRTRMKFVTC